MATKIIVSYDGTDNDHDALALGNLLAGPTGDLELAYVRHAHEAQTGRERLIEKDAEALLAGGAEVIGRPDIAQHVVLSASTPEGLRTLVADEHASVIVFGSEYRTAKGHVDPQASARRLLDGGPGGVAIAPAGFADVQGYEVASIVAVGEEGDPCALETAESLAARSGATVSVGTSRDVGGSPDFLVVGSRSGTVTGRVTLSAAAEYLIELARCPVLVLPRGVAVSFANP
jgi:nucleotide-binding universal stress UspA family protein